MILNLLLLFGLLFHSVFSDKETEGKTNEQPESSLRFANIDILSRDETLAQIFLYQSPNEEGVLVSSDKKEYVQQMLNPAVKTYVMFNGHPSKDSTIPYKYLRAALFQEGSANIFFVYIDWTKHAITFVDALALADSLGQYVGDTLLSFRIENPHFIAHCAGAEIATSVARHMADRIYTKIPRLTVFDPYITNKTKLNYASNFADFIDVYHAGIYVPAFPPVGTLDFYPNSGMKQPGCEGNSVQKTFLCHHRRSIYLYTESVTRTVYAIEANYDVIESQLQVLDEPKVIPFGHKATFAVNGSFYLPTFDTAPFLMDYF